MTKKWKVGDVIQIPLDTNCFAYAWVLEDPLFAFFDFVGTGANDEWEAILNKNIAFKTWVSQRAQKEGKWQMVGNCPVPVDEVSSQLFFRQDPISRKIFQYNRAVDNSQPITWEDACSMERAAVWEPDHIEERLFANFKGEASLWVERLKPKKT